MNNKVFFIPYTMELADSLRTAKELAVESMAMEDDNLVASTITSDGKKAQAVFLSEDGFRIAQRKIKRLAILTEDDCNHGGKMSERELDEFTEANMTDALDEFEYEDENDEYLDCQEDDYEDEEDEEEEDEEEEDEENLD